MKLSKIKIALPFSTSVTGTSAINKELFKVKEKIVALIVETKWAQNAIKVLKGR